jgi:hypothetical protein
MLVEGAEVPSQLELLVDVNFLVTEDCARSQHRASQIHRTAHRRRRAQRREVHWVKVSKLLRHDRNHLQLVLLSIGQLAQVDAEDLRADRGCQGLDLRRRGEQALLLRIRVQPAVGYVDLLQCVPLQVRERRL